MISIYLCLIFGILFSYSLDTVQITLTSNRVSQPIPGDYVGFSYEVSGILAMTGKYPSPPKSSFINLLNNLKQTPGAPGPNLRIGGNSADESWWDPDNQPKPPNINYDIGPNDLISVNNVAKAVNGTIVFDVDFRQTSDPLWAVNHVKGIKDTIGFQYVSGIEIGNECDLYKGNGIRPTNFTFEEYEMQWENYVTAIYAAGAPKPIIQGATFCCMVADFLNGLPGYMSKYKSLLASVSYHRYPSDHCNGRVVTMDQLLSDSASAHQAQLMAPISKAALDLKIPFVIGEGNSVACGGMPNVSNVFGSALWAVDMLLNMAAVNVTRFNFHGGYNSIYTAIAFSNSTSNEPVARPLYYAMWLISEVTSDYATILEVNAKTTNEFIKSWGLVSNKGQTRVVVVHKDLKATVDAEVTIVPSRKSTSPAQLVFLSSKEGIYAENGLSYAGLTYDGTTDGKPIGNRVVTNVNPNDNGDYVFTLPVAHIAYIIVP